MELNEKITGTRIILNRIGKSFELAKTFVQGVSGSVNELSPWLDWAHPDYGAEEAYEYFVFCEKGWKTGTHLTYLIENQKGEFVGVLSAKIDNDNRQTILGYWLVTNYTRNGYIQEAVALLERELFAADVNKIVIRTDVNNHKSANVAQKLGYHLDGILRQEMYVKKDNSFRDINVFSKLKSEGMN